MAIAIHEPATLAPALRRPFGLFLNLNGTLAPIAPRPEAAVVPEPTRRALEQVVGHADLVVVVTGTPAEHARQMVGVEGIIYVGNHGWEQVGPDGAVRFSPPVEGNLYAAADDVLRRLGEPGVTIERKGSGVGIHFRGARNPRAVRKHLLAALQPGQSRRHYQLVEGRCLIELRPFAGCDKGEAIVRLITERAIAGALYLGDDRSDIPAFQAVRRLRAAGGFGIAVAVAHEEAVASVSEAADFLVDGPAGVLRILHWLASTLSRLPIER
jgi:trehalose-phosphatase